MPLISVATLLLPHLWEGEEAAEVGQVQGKARINEDRGRNLTALINVAAAMLAARMQLAGYVVVPAA